MRAHNVRRLLREGEGQAAVELALVLPVLLLLLLGLVQVAAVFSAYLNLQMGASEGARVAITGASDSAIVQRVDTICQTLNQSSLTVSVSPSAPRSSGTDVTVTVNYTMPILFGYVSQLWGVSIPLTDSVTMQME